MIAPPAAPAGCATSITGNGTLMAIADLSDVWVVADLFESDAAIAAPGARAKVSLPTGYELTWGGEFENQERAMKRLTLVLPLSILLTFLLLFSAFGTVWDAADHPGQHAGRPARGLVGLAAVGMTLSVSAAVGFIALLGQAVLNGVLVVSAIRTRLDHGEDPWTATIEGARDRLRAVLLTAMLASLGLLPAAMSHAIGSETSGRSPSWSSAARSRRRCSP